MLNGRYESLIEQLTQRLKTAIEVNGADGLVSTGPEGFLFFALVLFDLWGEFAIRSCRKKVIFINGNLTLKRCRMLTLIAGQDKLFIRGDGEKCAINLMT